MKHSLRKAIRSIAVGGAVVALAGTAFAATQGTTGFNSTGTLDISLTVLDEVRISNLTDINLGAFAGVDMTGSSNACVYRNTTGAYQITGTGDGAANAFTLTDAVNTVPYSVSFDDGSGPQSLTSAIALTGRTGADTASDTCAGTGDNAVVSVTVLASNAAALPASAYAGTLTLVVAPE